VVIGLRGLWFQENAFLADLLSWILLIFSLLPMYKTRKRIDAPRQLPESRRWTSHVVINWTAGSREEFRQFEVKRGFATQEEACQSAQPV
jgi:hypothetical protein